MRRSLWREQLEVNGLSATGFWDRACRPTPGAELDAASSPLHGSLANGGPTTMPSRTCHGASS